MSKCTWPTPNLPQQFHRPEPIRNTLAKMPKIMSSQSLGQGKIGHSSYKSEMLVYIISQQISFLAQLEAAPLFKSP